MPPTEPDRAPRSSTRRFAFTVERLDRLRSSVARFYVFDERTPSLAVAVTPAGTRTFYVVRRVNGRPERMRLGEFPVMTIDQARRAAAEVNATVARGQSPMGLKREQREELTLGALWDYWLNAHAKARKKPRSVAEDERNWTRHLAGWKARKLSEITRADVRARHSAVGAEAGPYAANRAMALLSAMYNLAAEDHDYNGVNPCSRIKRFPERSRERFLSPAELPAFVAALEAEPNETLRDLIWMLLVTGQRKGTVKSMRWVDVDLHAALWRVPGETLKNGDPLTVPLPPKAMQILTRREHLAATSAYVFPGRINGTCIQEPKGAWARLIERAHLRDLRVHDLRRTMGSWQTSLGTSEAVIQRTLGHRSPAATRTYTRVQIDTVRDSMTSATTAMLEAAAPPPSPTKRKRVPNTARTSKPRRLVR